MILFQWLDNIPLYHCMSLVHLSADGHLGSFRFLAFMIYVQVFVWAYIFVSLNSNSISDAQGTWLRTGGSGIEVSLGFQQQTHGSPVRSVFLVELPLWHSCSAQNACRRKSTGALTFTFTLHITDCNSQSLLCQASWCELTYFAFWVVFSEGGFDSSAMSAFSAELVYTNIWVFCCLLPFLAHQSEC